MKVINGICPSDRVNSTPLAPLSPSLPPPGGEIHVPPPKGVVRRGFLKGAKWVGDNGGKSEEERQRERCAARRINGRREGGKGEKIGRGVGPGERAETIRRGIKCRRGNYSVFHRPGRENVERPFKIRFCLCPCTYICVCLVKNSEFIIIRKKVFAKKGQI